ncbi:L,D-transpeptidase family protein [Jannaschia seohaensis]|uniref:L,D-transpeptidase catalytic domain n=1 Tax=Jannaschia seohaensis TaxID=475081 RepID=A0A2Y9AE50_9RHOB|nr:L,D-transpeptidase family protein [Jannaschia seohaensis]PWJ21128.1 L,D-transpeptidase-like protein [Jannaschia seohaensis]SSA41538.1 L,D-transpeptidase catalytic domain [Jannaschia seohaensis]
MSRSRRVIFALAACLLAVSAPPGPAEPLRQDATFQALLDAHDIPLVLPERGKAIVVNIPAFEMIAFEDAVPVLRSRVIVGTPWHRTPRLETYATVVRFRPTWRPTPSMVASGEYPNRIWPAGPNNPLGLAAVRLQPGLLVYLHDTNRPELFEKEVRALSHGCVRVEAWDRLIAWLLDWPLAEVHRLAQGGRTTDVPTEPVPVVLAYLRRFPDETGTVVEHPDIYGLSPSAKLEEAGCLEVDSG